MATAITTLFEVHSGSLETYGWRLGGSVHYFIQSMLHTGHEQQSPECLLWKSCTLSSSLCRLCHSVCLSPDFLLLPLEVELSFYSWIWWLFFCLAGTISKRFCSSSNGMSCAVVVIALFHSLWWSDSGLEVTQLWLSLSLVYLMLSLLSRIQYPKIPP